MVSAAVSSSVRPKGIQLISLRVHFFRIAMLLVSNCYLLAGIFFLHCRTLVLLFRQIVLSFGSPLFQKGLSRFFKSDFFDLHFAHAGGAPQLLM